MSDRRQRCPHPEELSRALHDGGGEALRAHVAACDYCQAEWRRDHELARLARELPRATPGDDHATQVGRAILDAAGRTAAPQASPRSRRVLWAVTAVAAACAGAVASRLLLERPPVAPVAAPAPVQHGTVHAHAGAEFIRIGAAPNEIVRLTQGSITVEVAPLHLGERFRVITDDGEVEVRGTAFDVAADGDRLRAVRVYHGSVEVRRGHEAQTVLAAGERWDAPPSEHVVAAPTPRPTPAGAAVAEALPPREPRPRPSVAAAEPTAEPPAAPPPTNKRPIEVLFEEGFAALNTGDLAHAAARFEAAALAAPDNPLAEDAWFWHGATLARLKRAAAGTDALKTFLARYPSSPRFGEASAMLGWLLLDAGDVAGAEVRFRAAVDDRVDAVRASARKGLEAVAQRRMTPP